MTLTELIGREEAGAILNVDSRTVPRYAERGLLASVQNGSRGIDYKRSAVADLRRDFKARDSLEPCIKELYAVVACEVPYTQIRSEFEISQDTLERALKLYMVKRTAYLRKFGIPDDEHSELLLVTEATARLKASHTQIIYDLISSGTIEAKIVRFGGRKRYFVRLDSFKAYLGKYARRLLYRSHTVASRTRRTINYVDKLANANGIGFKTKESPQGNYLFSENDVLKLSKLRRRH